MWKLKYKIHLSSGWDKEWQPWFEYKTRQEARDQLKRQKQAYPAYSDRSLYRFEIVFELPKQIVKLSDYEKGYQAGYQAGMEEAAKIAENWGNAPPNPYGRRAQLAADIRKVAKLQREISKEKHNG